MLTTHTHFRDTTLPQYGLQLGLLPPPVVPKPTVTIHIGVGSLADNNITIYGYACVCV